MERSSVITTFLVGCLTLGFFCLFSVYLPTQLSQAKGSLPVNPIPLSTTQSLSEVVNHLTPPSPRQPEQLAILPSTRKVEETSEQEEIQPGIPDDDDEDNRDDGQFLAMNGMLVPHHRHHHKTHSHFKTHAKKSHAKHSVSSKEANNYPLKMYEPLEEIFKRHYEHGFVVGSSIQPAFELWRNVYGRYELNKTILHDNKYMDIVYGVLDFSNLENNRDARLAIEEKKREDLRAMLLGFEAGEQPKTAGEHIVYQLFENVEEPNKFANAAERIRSQWGQKDRFMAGLIRAGRYLPMMEEIFIREGAPKEITRLVFVESMFNLGAISKVGASGPWQFMPGTAKLYMTMNHFVDERHDPLIAAQAAARLLLKNYELVHSWPLAINGYNTGVLRMVKAVNRLGTKDIGEIITRFDDSGYQFASRNFYPEFLAALEVVDHHKDYFGELQLDKPIPFDEVTFPYPTSISKLAEQTATDMNVLKDLNPAYFDHCFSPKTILPKGYTINVPHQQKLLFLAALDQIHNQAKEIRLHIASKGETLQQIADQYQITVAMLKETNGMIGHHVKPGQVIKIPSLPEKLVLKTAN